MSRNLLHHANLLVGREEEAEVYLKSLCNSLDIKIANNPDFFAFRLPTFGIDEARELSLYASRKAVTGKKIFFISPKHLTAEAQNALLKTFEDPFRDTHFFLVVREEALIIPTLLSRMQSIRVSENSENESGVAKKFLSLPIKDRLLFAKKFADEEGNLSIFLDDLLIHLRKDKGSSKLLEMVYNIRRSIADSIVSPRLAMEHLSLVL